MRTIAWFAIFVLGAGGSSRAYGTDEPTPAPYAQALQTANMFLWAWVTCDQELGSRLLSSNLLVDLQRDPEGVVGFQQYMSGLSNPHHLSFEIAQGRLLSAGRAAFTVTLFEHDQGDSTAYRYDSAIELIRDPGPGSEPDSLVRSRVARLTERIEWKVDVLPAAPYRP